MKAICSALGHEILLAESITGHFYIWCTICKEGYVYDPNSEEITSWDYDRPMDYPQPVHPSLVPREVMDVVSSLREGSYVDI